MSSSSYKETECETSELVEYGENGPSTTYVGLNKPTGVLRYLVAVVTDEAQLQGFFKTDHMASPPLHSVQFRPIGESWLIFQKGIFQILFLFNPFNWCLW